MQCPENMPAPVRVWEIPALLGALTLLLAVQMLLIGALASWQAKQMQIAVGFISLTHQFWLDELLTEVVVSDPDLSHALDALAHGATAIDPPGFSLSLRVFAAVVPGSPEVTYRCFTLLTALLALAGIYVHLRQRLNPLVCGVSILSLWCAPLFVNYAFEARPYSLWFAALTWFAFFLGQCRDHPTRIGWHIGLGATAILLGTVHYFGVLTEALVVAGEYIGRRGPGRLRWPCLLAIALGPLSWLGCLGFLRGQRAVYTVAYFSTLPSGTEFFLVLTRVVLPAAACFLLWRLYRRFRPPVSNDAEWEKLRDQLSPFGGLIALLFLPLIVIGLGYILQGAIAARYALPALAALPPVLAFLLARLPTAAVGFVGLLLALGGGWLLAEQANAARDADRLINGYISTIRSLPGDELVVFESPHPLFAICHYAPDLVPRCPLLDFEVEQVGPASDYRVFTRDWVRQHATYFGIPRLLTWDELRRLPHALLVPALNEYATVGGSRERYPGFVVEPKNSLLFELVADQPGRR
jgi:hypothetical protein